MKCVFYFKYNQSLLFYNARKSTKYERTKYMKLSMTIYLQEKNVDMKYKLI